MESGPRRHPFVDGRIMGMEMEWTTIVKLEGKVDTGFFTGTRSSDFLWLCVPESVKFPELEFNRFSHTLVKIFLTNGACIYIDTGAHVEYATPEELDPFALLLAVRAGDRIVEESVANVKIRWRDKEISAASFKGNLDISNDPGRACGTHENYLLLCGDDLNPHLVLYNLQWLISPFLMSRVIFTGNGWWLQDGGYVYLLSQRAKVMERLLGGASTSSRPIILTRDEPHAQRDKYQRLQILIGDSLVFDTAVVIQVGTTSMVLDMIEEGFFTQSPFGANEAEFFWALRAFNSDPTLTVTAELGGKRYSAVDIQEFFWEKVSQFYEERGVEDSMRLDLLALWGFLIQQARKPNPHEKLAPFVDWAAKLMLIKHEFHRKGILLNPQQGNLQVLNDNERVHPSYAGLKAIEFAFGKNHPSSYGRKFLDEKGRAMRMVSEEEIQAAIKAPTRSNTRASARSRQLHWFSELAIKHKRTFVMEVDWTLTKAIKRETASAVHEFPNPDPYESDPHLPDPENIVL